MRLVGLAAGVALVAIAVVVATIAIGGIPGEGRTDEDAIEDLLRDAVALQNMRDAGRLYLLLPPSARVACTLEDFRDSVAEAFLASPSGDVAVSDVNVEVTGDTAVASYDVLLDDRTVHAVRDDRFVREGDRWYDAVDPHTLFCAPEEAKTVKIVSDLPLQGADLVQTGQMVEAIEYVLEQSNYRAGDYTIEYESFDDAVASTGSWDEAKCTENARTYVEDGSIVGVIGPYNSGCAAIEIPILNQASIAIVSPANTYPGLSHAAPGTEAGEPEKYYPTGVRNYVRVVASDDVQGKVGAAHMKSLGVTKVFILDDGELYGRTVADAFESAAPEVGLRVVGRRAWAGSAPTYRSLMARIGATGADGIYICGISANDGGQLVEDKVAVLGDNQSVQVLVCDAFVTSAVLEKAGAANANGVYGTAPTQPADSLTGSGAAFVSGLQRRIGAAKIDPYAALAAAATQVLLDAIERSDGTREGIVAKLLETNLSDSVIGPLSFDENGDRAREWVYRAASGRWELWSRPSNTAQEASPPQASSQPSPSPGAPSGGSERFDVKPCGSIVDLSTRLEWFVGPDVDMTWDAAVRWVTTLASCGGGWRMPSVSELQGLYERGAAAGTGYVKAGKHFPAQIDPAFSGIGRGSWVWTGKEISASVAAAVNMHENIEVRFEKRQGTYPVRPFAVRAARPS